MRLLALAALLLPTLSAAQLQLPLLSQPPAPVEPLSVKLVDLLSQSHDHQLLLRAFQKARLIPALNRLNGSTLFAPTDAAIAEAAQAEHPLWSIFAREEFNFDSLPDNVQLELRETLHYHMLNYTLFPAPPVSPSNDTDPDTNSTQFGPSLLPIGVVTLQETLLFPTNAPPPEKPQLPGSPGRSDPDGPHRKDGLLRGAGQRLRVIRKKAASKDTDTEVWVGGDWKGEEGTNVLGRPQFAKNGALVSIGAVLDVPKSVASIVRHELHLSTFSSLLPDELLDYLANTSHLTVFAPTNPAWNSLSRLGLDYLGTSAAKHDLRDLFHELVSEKGEGKDKVAYLAEHNKNWTVTTLADTKLEISFGKHDTVRVDGFEVEEGDLFASNGVVNTVPSLLSTKLKITPEKLLLGAKVHTFAELLRIANFSWMLDPPKIDRAFILLAPTEDAISNLNLTRYLANPAALADLIKLHIIPTDALEPMPANGKPIQFKDEASFQTLFEKKFGTIAFRKKDDDWLVGIKAARGGNGTDSARVVSWGRQSPWLVPGEDGEALVANGGGVILIDRVLLPIEESWPRQHLLLIVLSIAGVVISVVLFAVLGWLIWKRTRKNEYEHLEGEEE